MERIDCDVFMKDGSALDLFDKVICITGNFYAGNDCYVSTAIIADENVIFEDFADTVAICAGGSVYIGRFSKTGSIWAGQDIILDDYSCSNYLLAKQEVLLGDDTSTYEVTAEGGIISSDYQKPETFWSSFFTKIANFLFK